VGIFLNVVQSLLERAMRFLDLILSKIIRKTCSVVDSRPFADQIEITWK